MTEQNPSARSATPWGPIEYELRIGVTGHRELDNPAAVETAVRELLETVVKTLQKASAEPRGPHGRVDSRAHSMDRRLAGALSGLTHAAGPILDALTRPLAREWRWPRVAAPADGPSPGQQTPLKLTAITCLAQGADQIVASVVCDMVTNKNDRNRYCEAVLPFPQTIYEKEFDNETDLERFRALLSLDRGQDNTHLEPTVVYRKVAARGDPAPPGSTSREEAFAAAGRHIVNTSEIIVAIWDPKRPERAGGTAETVRYALAQGRTVLWINPSELSAHARLLRFAPRHKTGTEALTFTAGGHSFLAQPLPTQARTLSRNFHRLAAYNRDQIVSLDDLNTSWAQDAARLNQVFDRHALPERARDTIVNFLLPRYVRANLAASRYHELRDFAARLWPVTAALVVTLMAFQIVFVPQHYWVAFIELVVLLLGYLSYRVSLYDAWHAKWLNDRRLAEGLRGALFTSLLPPDPERALARSRRMTGPSAAQIQNPLPFYSPAASWFVDSLKRVIAKERRKFEEVLTLDTLEQRKAVRNVLREAWIDDQAAHHRKTAQKRARTAIAGKRFRFGMIVLLGVVAIFHGAGLGHGDAHGGHSWIRWDLVFGFLSVALPAWAAALHVMLSLDDHERLAERATHMADLLEGLSDELEHVEALNALRETIVEAERVMELETAEWAESLGDRKPEFTG